MIAISVLMPPSSTLSNNQQLLMNSPRTDEIRKFFDRTRQTNSQIARSWKRAHKEYDEGENRIALSLEQR